MDTDFIDLDDDTLDLIGDVPKPESTLDRIVRERRMDSGAASLDLADVHSGVTVAWLSQVFGMDPTTVKKRLGDCPPLYRRKAGYVYDVKVAAQYLVKPVFDVKAYLKNMRPSELPSQLQKEYWDAALKRQRWEERAGQLWRTDAVMETFGEVFKSLKFTLQLWADSLERQTGLSADQRKLLIAMVDSLQDELHKSLVGIADRRQTHPVSAEVEEDDDA